MRTLLGFVVYVASPYIWGATSVIDRWLTWGFGATPRERRSNACMLLCIWLLISAAGFLLGGCSLVPHYSEIKALADQGIDTAIEDRQDVNDKKAEVIKALAGEVSHGAYLRTYTPVEQCAIDTLILGAAPYHCSANDRLAVLLERLFPQPAQTPATASSASFPPSAVSPELGP